MSAQIETLSNGLTIIVEEIPHAESVAFDLSIPGGIVLDRPELVGLSLILPELTSRGAGGLTAHQLSEAFDICGIRHSESGGHDRFTYRATLLSSHLAEALRLMSLMIRNPDFPEGDVANIKSLLLQDIASLADNPARRCMVELGKRYYPPPFNRPSMGEEQGIGGVSLSELRSDWKARFAPHGSILSVAGKCKQGEVRALVEDLFSDWSGKTQQLPIFGDLPAHKSYHIDQESAQLQIALAYPSARFEEQYYYAAKVATGILSGGMFGRLFTEVREKRGLCYSVYARHSSTKDYGVVTAYAGTTPERAQETLDVLLAELRNMPGTVTGEELSRSKINIKSALVIGEESTSSRASSNLQDWWVGKRVRPLEEVISAIDAVDLREIDAYLHAFEPKSVMLLTLGSKELRLNG